MWRNTALILIFALVSACIEHVPDYSSLADAETREQLKSRFGEPDLIQSGKYQPDVVSLNEPPLRYTEFEYWEYISTNDGEIGRAFFSFYVNKLTSEEMLGDMNWLSDEELSFISR